MKNTMKRMLCLLLALCMCAGLALGAAAEEDGKGEDADGIDNSEGNGGNSVEVDIDGGDQTVYVGQEGFKLTFTSSPLDYSGSVTWSSSAPDVAAVDGEGNVNIGKPGEATIKLILGDNKATDSIVITVEDDAVATFAVSSPDTTIDAGTIRLKGKTAFTLKGETTYESGRTADGANWGSILDANGDKGLYIVARRSDAGEFLTQGIGTAKIEVKCPDNEEKNVIITVIVENAPLTALTIKGGAASGAAQLTVGGTLALSAARSPETTFNSEPIAWSSSNENAATVNDEGVVTAVAKGDATITASCKEGDKTITAKTAVKVGDPTADISKSTTRSNDLSYGGIYSELVEKFTAAHGKPSDSATFRFGTLGSATCGTLYTNRSANTKVVASKDYNLSDVNSMYFVPGSVGSYEMTYTLTCDGRTLTGKITVTVTGLKSKDITIRLKDDSPYALKSSTTLDNVSAVSAISTAIKDASGLNYSYIVFKSPGSASSRVGTLYPDPTKKYDLSNYNSYTAGSTSNPKQSPVSNLYFDPKKEGAYSIPYTAYGTSDNELCSGDLIIVVGATDSATVTVTLDDDGSYTFASKTKKDKISAATAIDDAIKDETKATYSYIEFGSIVSGSSVGTLYADSDRTAIKASAQYKRSASTGDSVSGLYFVPERSGTYVRSFIAYDSNGKKLLEGTLKLVVPSEGGSGMDVYFNTTTGSAVSLGENVFESWYRQQKGTNYKLAYVTFDGASRSFGTFKHSSSSFTPGDEVKYFARGYTGSVGSSPKYLDNVKYAAPNTTGYVSVDFTCYGGTGSSAYSTKVSGTFFIFVTGGSVKGITRDVKYGSAVTLSEGEFSSVHASAMSLSPGASTRHYIELLEIPSKGTLYYGYTSASKPGTKLTGSNFDGYEFYVSSGSSYDSVSDLTYVPANASSGAVSVRYLARSTNGDPMYVGSVSFSYGRQQGASVSCGADGYTFKTSDFYSSGEADPVAYVTFAQPDSGELMLGYANGRGVPLDSAVRLYTSKAANGSYPLSSLSYIPKAGFSGNVEIYYTAVTEAGKSQSGVMTVAVTGRKGSAHFKDVHSGGSGAWAADAIDFAYKWGLVNGTGTDTFSPDNTMTRAMLVTILYRSAGSPKASGSCPFTDVAAGTYYYDAVIWAAQNGIVTGTSATTFSPDRDVNREQVAAFLHRYAKYNGENVTVTGTLSGYADKSFVSPYAIEPVSWAVQHGYITSNSGTEELLLSPGGNATRAQVAVMLHRFLTY